MSWMEPTEIVRRNSHSVPAVVASDDLGQGADTICVRSEDEADYFEAVNCVALRKIGDALREHTSKGIRRSSASYAECVPTCCTSPPSEDVASDEMSTTSSDSTPSTSSSEFACTHLSKRMRTESFETKGGRSSRRVSLMTRAQAADAVAFLLFCDLNNEDPIVCASASNVVRVLEILTMCCRSMTCSSYKHCVVSQTSRSYSGRFDILMDHSYDSDADANTRRVCKIVRVLMSAGAKFDATGKRVCERAAQLFETHPSELTCVSIAYAVATSTYAQRVRKISNDAFAAWEEFATYYVDRCKTPWSEREASDRVSVPHFVSSHDRKGFVMVLDIVSDMLKTELTYYLSKLDTCERRKMLDHVVEYLGLVLHSIDAAWSVLNSSLSAYLIEDEALACLPYEQLCCCLIELKGRHPEHVVGAEIVSKASHDIARALDLYGSIDVSNGVLIPFRFDRLASVAALLVSHDSETYLELGRALKDARPSLPANALMKRRRFDAELKSGVVRPPCQPAFATFCPPDNLTERKMRSVMQSYSSELAEAWRGRVSSVATLRASPPDKEVCTAMVVRQIMDLTLMRANKRSRSMDHVPILAAFPQAQCFWD